MESFEEKICEIESFVICHFDDSFLSFVISRKISYKISAKIPSRIINAAEQ